MAKQAVGEGSVRVAPLVAIPALLREFGADPAAVFASCGVDYRILDDPDNPIPFAAAGRLLSRSVAVTACPHFGLLLGQNGNAATLGVLGHLAMNSPDVGTALRNLILRLHQHDRGAVPTLSVDGSHAVLAYWIYQPGVEGCDQIYDLAIAVAHKLMQDLCGPAWSPDEVLFAHHRPDELTPFRRFFRAPLRFDADQTALVFASTWLSQPVAGADAHLRTILEAHLSSVECLDDVPIVEKLRRVLRPLIMTARGDEGHAAEMLSLHRRTLNRRLKASGTTFHAIAEEIRFEVARQLLRDTRMSMQEIAASLDYADSSAFGRAFRRWSGTSPAQWRSFGSDQDPEQDVMDSREPSQDLGGTSTCP